MSVYMELRIELVQSPTRPSYERKKNAHVRMCKPEGGTWRACFGRFQLVVDLFDDHLLLLGVHTLKAYRES